MILFHSAAVYKIITLNQYVDKFNCSHSLCFTLDHEQTSDRQASRQSRKTTYLLVFWRTSHHRNKVLFAFHRKCGVFFKIKIETPSFRWLFSFLSFSVKPKFNIFVNKFRIWFTCVIEKCIVLITLIFKFDF